MEYDAINNCPHMWIGEEPMKGRLWSFALAASTSSVAVAQTPTPPAAGSYTVSAAVQSPTTGGTTCEIPTGSGFWDVAHGTFQYPGAGKPGAVSNYTQYGASGQPFYPLEYWTGPEGDVPHPIAIRIIWPLTPNKGATYWNGTVAMSVVPAPPPDKPALAKVTGAFSATINFIDARTFDMNVTTVWATVQGPCTITE